MSQTRKYFITFIYERIFIRRVQNGSSKLTTLTLALPDTVIDDVVSL